VIVIIGLLMVVVVGLLVVVVVGLLVVIVILHSIGIVIISLVVITSVNISLVIIISLVSITIVVDLNRTIGVTTKDALVHEQEERTRSEVKFESMQSRKQEKGFERFVMTYGALRAFLNY